MIRAFEAGMIIALLAPIVGTFLIVRRYALMADTLAHVSLAGVAIGVWIGTPPVATATVTTLLAALG